VKRRQSLYTFNMDEYADENGNIAPESRPNSFMYNMKVNFHAKLDADLRRPRFKVLRMGTSRTTVR